jgi:hypothetical protein
VTPARPTKFQRLARTHAAMAAGEATLVVALADSFFFDVDPDAARGKVLLFLLVSFAPFLVVAPLIGPVIDRISGGRRLVVQAVAAARIALQLMMIAVADELLLFPLVFAALVLQKTYLVSKSALVPSVVPTERDLVEANAKLGVIAGVTGFVAVIPALLLQVALGTSATLVYDSLGSEGSSNRSGSGKRRSSDPARCGLRPRRCWCCARASASCCSTSRSGFDRPTPAPRGSRWPS